MCGGTDGWLASSSPSSSAPSWRSSRNTAPPIALSSGATSLPTLSASSSPPSSPRYSSENIFERSFVETSRKLCELHVGRKIFDFSHWRKIRWSFTLAQCTYLAEALLELLPILPLKGEVPCSGVGVGTNGELRVES
jgi:hypothetical protein